MGRAYEVRKASIQKTGAAKAKLYSMYAREIYQAAKTGGTDPISNATLKRLMEKAKKEQVPQDIIKRAVDKVNSGADESYDNVKYELFGPAGSTIIVDCLTDNVNRSVSNLRAVLNSLIENDVEITDLEVEDDLMTIYGDPTDLFKIKEAILTLDEKIEFELDEIALFPKETIKLDGEDLEVFNKLMTMLDDIEDVQHVYHNVELA